MLLKYIKDNKYPRYYLIEDRIIVFKFSFFSYMFWRTFGFERGTYG